MITFFKALEGALAHLEDVEGVEAQEVHEVDIDITACNTQCCMVNFPEWNYMCFTYSDWQEGDFIGYRTDECYYCGKKTEDDQDCLCLEAEIA